MAVGCLLMWADLSRHCIVTRTALDGILETIYAARSDPLRRIEHHQLGLVFAVLAMGTLHDMELEANDPLATEYLDLAKASLTRGNFLQNNTVAALQALHIVAHVHLETEGGKNGDSAWPLWGLSMRMVVAMGLHRDGFRWGLDEKVVQERRLLYWQCQSTDIMQANCFSRPQVSPLATYSADGISASLSSSYADTRFPLDLDEKTRLAQSHKSFHQLKYELSRISESVLEVVLKVHEPAPQIVQALQEQLVLFEKQVPFVLRSRTAYSSLPSLYTNPEDALIDTPEIDKRNLALTLQQFALSITISETMLFLNRPFYAKAFGEAQHDPSQSQYAQAYLVVVERSNVSVVGVGER